MSNKELWHFVCDVGKRLKRPADDLEPYYNTLLDNWYDTIDGLAGAAAEELASVGIPLRFAKELVVAAQAAESKGRHEGSGKSQGKDSKDKDRGKGGGKSKGKGKSDHKSSRDEVEHILELEGGLDPGFDIKRHLIGERGRNVHHIQDQTGCSVMVEGGGSEPPSIVIRGPSEAALKKAVEQATDLSNAVYGQYQEWLDEQYGRPKAGKESSKGKGKGKHKGKDGKDKDKHKESSKGGNGKGGGDYKQVVDCWDADPAFRLKGKIIGENGRNLHHVQDQSGAQVWVKGSDNEIPYLEITAPSHHALQEAVDLCNDLLNVVKEEYEEWQRGGGNGGGGGGGSEGGGKGKGKHKGKDKDKGKGKGKWRNRDGDEDPPAKRQRYH